MDWLDEKIDNLRNRPQSLQLSLAFYLIIGSLLVVVLYLLTISACISWERLLLGEDDYLFTWQFFAWQGPPATKLPYDLNDTIMMIRYIRRFSLVLYAVAAIFGVTFAFYRNRIRQPLLILKSGIQSIKEGDLSKPFYYKGGDEFEEVTEGLEEMRQHLIHSQNEIQDLNVEQRKVNAAFSHDIRTPLSVIQNNAELIETFQGTGQLDEEHLLKALGKIKNNVVRLADFSQTMQEIQKIDEINLAREYQSLEKFTEEVRAIGNTLAKGIFQLQLEGDFEKKVRYDLQIMMEVAENLLSNASRYAEHSIKVTLQHQDQFLYLFVQDDGGGFSRDELREATQPYFSGDKKHHFGLGLTICDALTRKHGGMLRLGNSVNGGAIVTAIFTLQ